MAVERRFSQLVLGTDKGNGWVIHWTSGSDTGFHDHGHSWGTITVVEGYVLEERFSVIDPSKLLRGVFGQGDVLYLDPSVIHRVWAEQSAISVHIYTPALKVMRTYDRSGKLTGEQSAEKELHASRK